MRGLERAENTTLRWMCGVTLDRKRTAELMDRLGIVSVEVTVNHGRLRW